MGFVIPSVPAVGDQVTASQGAIIAGDLAYLGGLAPTFETKVTSSVAGINSTTLVTLADAPAVAGDGAMKYLITASFYNLGGTVATDVFDLVVQDSTLGVSIRWGRCTTNSTFLGIKSDAVVLICTDIPSAGTHVYRFAAKRAGGTGTGTVFGDSVTPINILVQRIA